MVPSDYARKLAQTKATPLFSECQPHSTESMSVGANCFFFVLEFAAKKNYEEKFKNKFKQVKLNNKSYTNATI